MEFDKNLYSSEVTVLELKHELVLQFKYSKVSKYKKRDLLHKTIEDN